MNINPYYYCFQVVTLHSQSMSVPECPKNYDSLWIGYSFAFQNGAGNQAAGQRLTSPGYYIKITIILIRISLCTMSFGTHAKYFR